MIHLAESLLRGKCANLDYSDLNDYCDQFKTFITDKRQSFMLFNKPKPKSKKIGKNQNP